MPTTALHESNVLTKAVVRAAKTLDVNHAKLAEVLGLSESTGLALFAGDYRLKRDRGKAWELALLFVRMYRSLELVLGSSQKARAWLKHRNAALNTKPIKLLSTVEGLVTVLHYVNSARR